MHLALLDLTDCNLQLWHGDVHVQSPGYVLLDKGAFVFGHEACGSARIRPRDINTQFWWRLGTEPLQPSLGAARHTGDLAHAHLNDLHAAAGGPNGMLFAVPSSMSREQLSLLLGIVQQCPFKATGLVNRSVALASLHNSHDTVVHLELQLHQAVVNVIPLDNGTRTLERQQTLPGCGLLQLQERLAETIAAAFVRQARFDPRRKANSEQELYDLLPCVLDNLQRQSETTIDVGGHQARIAQSELAPCSERLRAGALNAIGDDLRHAPVMIEPLTASLPGITDWLTCAHLLEADSLQRALREHAVSSPLPGETLSLITALPSLARKIPGAAQATRNTQVPKPTHLLLGHRASALISGGHALAEDWLIEQVNGEWQLAGGGTPPLVNKRDYAPGQVLKAGDVIRIGPHYTAQLISVEA